MRRPEQCPFRAPTGRGGLARCGMVARLLADGAAGLDLVDPGACEACCRCLLPAEDLNPVIASLVFGATGAILRAGGVPGCGPSKARAIRAKVASHLGVVHPALADRAFPPEAAPAADGRTWAVGVITAPRRLPTLGRTLGSLSAAGFGPVRIFAEPGSMIPAEADGHRVIVHPARLGNFANFYNALASLYRDDPGAECVVLFQDDIEAADGLRAWCDAQLWPLGAGLVSLFTPRAHSGERPGWRLLRPGFHRVYGGQALAFRRDILERFLADPHVLREVHAGRHGDDAVVAAWAGRHRLPIAYHSPSLVQHVGPVSSIYEEGPDRRVVADAVAGVDRIAAWRPPPRRPGRVGLVGWDARTGLGYQNHDLASHLGVDRWLVPRHPSLRDRVEEPSPCRVDEASVDMGPRAAADWLEGLDWVLFIERPCVEGLAQIARARQVGVACVPNWEWLDPSLGWLPYVDLMICPTRHTFAHVDDWRRRYGFGWDVRHVPWPVDLGRFRFVERRRCDRFLFVNGWGGGRPRRLDGSATSYGRKGLELIVEAARAAPGLRFVVTSQYRLPKLPRNVELRPAPADNRRLYEVGDVCAQPSHFEGLGLQLLECQAAGMPLVTTDAPPMNEYEPMATVPVIGSEIARCEGDQPIASQLLDPADLARVLRAIHGSDIAAASRRARAFIEREHSWERALPLLRDGLVAL